MMKLTFKMFEYKGTPLYFNLLFLALFLLLPINITLFLFISILLHEIGHIHMAKKLGYNVEKGFVSIFGGGALVDEEFMKNNKDAIKISFAGPFINLSLSLISFLLLVLSGIFFGETAQVGSFLFENIFSFLIVNLMLGLINLIPVFSLDGGRIIYHLVDIYNNKLSTKISALISIFISLSFLYYSININDFLLIVFMIISIMYNVSRLNLNVLKR